MKPQPMAVLRKLSPGRWSVTHRGQPVGLVYSLGRYQWFASLPEKYDMAASTRQAAVHALVTEWKRQQLAAMPPPPPAPTPWWIDP